MKNNLKKAPVKFREDLLYFQHFYADCCLCPKLVIFTTLKTSFAVLIPLHFCPASLQGARHSWNNFSSVYVHALCVACAWPVRACIVRPSGFFRAITCNMDFKIIWHSCSP